MNIDTQTAIAAALSGNWKLAIQINLKLLKKDSRDIDSLNRLGRAYFETGQKTKAEAIYQKVLRLDKFNSIAIKNLDLLKTSRIPHQRPNSSASSRPPPQFLEEPGITKTVSLIRPGDPKITSRLHPGDSVSIVPHDHCISVVSSLNEYIGRLPDDLTSRLLPFLRSGNKYHAWIRSVEGLKVFIKEVTRVTKYRHTPSFPMTEKLNYTAFTPPVWVHDTKVNTQATEEQEDVSTSEPDVDDEPAETSNQEEN